MAWEPSTWLLVARIVQFLGAVAGTGLNGFVTGNIYKRDGNVPLTMVTLQLLICPILIYSVVAMIMQHRANRREKTGCLLTFIGIDILFLCANLAIVCILARAGLPQSCRGLLTFRPGTDQPQEPFTTLGFSDGRKDQRGELDKFCNHERANFIVSLCLIFTFQATAVFASLSYYKIQQAYTSKLHDGSSDDDLCLSPLRPTPSCPAPNPAPNNPRTSLANPAAPGSEGILTRNTSVRTTSTTAASLDNDARASLLPARPRRAPVPPLPRRSPSVASHHYSLSEMDIDETTDDTVADGMQYRLADPVLHHRPPPPPPSRPTPPDLPPSPTPTPRHPSPTPSLTPSHQAHHALISDGYAPRPSSSDFQTVPLDDERPTPPPPPKRSNSSSHARSISAAAAAAAGGAGSMPLLLEEDEVDGDDAHHALVSDGMRPAMEGLPPYRPPTPRGGEGEDVKGR